MSKQVLALIAAERAAQTGKLDLGNCELTNIPTEVFEMRWLQELILSNRYFDIENRQWIKSPNQGKPNILSGKIPNEIKHLEHLASLYCSGTKDCPWFIDDISAIKSLEDLEIIDFSYNAIKDITVFKWFNIRCLNNKNKQVISKREVEKLNHVLMDMCEHGTNTENIATLDLVLKKVATHIRFPSLDLVEDVAGYLIKDGKEQLFQMKFSDFYSQNFWVGDNTIFDIAIQQDCKIRNLNLSHNQIEDIEVLHDIINPVGLPRTFDDDDFDDDFFEEDKKVNIEITIENLEEKPIELNLTKEQQDFIKMFNPDIDISKDPIRYIWIDDNAIKNISLARLNKGNEGIFEHYKEIEQAKADEWYKEFKAERSAEGGGFKRIEQEKRERTGILDLSNGGFSEFPAVVFEMDWLETLILDKSEFKEDGTSFPNYFNELPEGLANLKNLKVLSLRGNRDKSGYSDLSVLKHFTKLEEFYCTNNRVSDISALQHLPNLKKLTLYDNFILDVSPIQGLSNLEKLKISRNPISNIDCSNFNKLKQLSLFNTGIKTLKTLSNCKALVNLVVQNSKLKDISFIADLVQLKTVELGNNRIEEIGAIAKLVNLEIIDLHYNYIQDISTLSKLTQLKKISLNDNKILNINPLAQLFNLEKLDLSNNEITDIKPLLPQLKRGMTIGDSYDAMICFEKTPIIYPSLEQIKELDNNDLIELIEKAAPTKKEPKGLWNKIVNFSFSKEVEEETVSPKAVKLIRAAIKTRTTKLSLPYCGLSTIPSAVFELTWLEELNFNNSGYSNTEKKNNLVGALPKGFHKLKSLKKLDLSGSVYIGAITDISALKGLKNLEELDVEWNLIEDISVLAHLPKLKEVYLGYNKITDISALANLLKLRLLYLRSNQVKDISALKRLVQLDTLWLNNNKIKDISALANLLKLRYLNLDHNDIVDVAPLKNLETHNIHLQFNEIETVEALIPLFRRQNYLHHTQGQVSIGQNPLKVPTLAKAQGWNFSMF